MSAKANEVTEISSKANGVNSTFTISPAPFGEQTQIDQIPATPKLARQSKFVRRQLSDNKPHNHPC